MKHPVLVTLMLLLLAGCMPVPPAELPRPDIGSQIIFDGVLEHRQNYPQRARLYLGRSPNELARRVFDTLRQEGYRITAFEPRLGVIIATRKVDNSEYRAFPGDAPTPKDQAIAKADIFGFNQIFVVSDHQQQRLTFVLKEAAVGTELLIDGIFWANERRKDMGLRTIVHEVPVRIPVAEVAGMFERLAGVPGFADAVAVAPPPRELIGERRIRVEGLASDEESIRFTLPRETTAQAATLMLQFVQRLHETSNISGVQYMQLPTYEPTTCVIT